MTYNAPGRPARFALKAAEWIGWIAAIIGAALLCYYLYKTEVMWCQQSWTGVDCGYAESYTWQTALAMTATGLIIGFTANGRYGYWYKQVTRGTVVGRSFYSGHYGDYYSLKVRGLSRAGEEVVDVIGVEPKTYLDAEHGEEISFR